MSHSELLGTMASCIFFSGVMVVYNSTYTVWVWLEYRMFEKEKMEKGMVKSIEMGLKRYPLVT